MQEYSRVLEPKMGQKAKMYSQTRAKHALLPRGGDLNLTSPFPKCKIARKLSKNKKKSKQDEVALTSKPCYFKLNKIILCKVSLVQNLSSPAGLEVASQIRSG